MFVGMGSDTTMELLSVMKIGSDFPKLTKKGTDRHTHTHKHTAWGSRKLIFLHNEESSIKRRSHNSFPKSLFTLNNWRGKG